MKPRVSRPNERGIVLVMTMLLVSMLLAVGYAFSYSSAVSLQAARHARRMMQREDGLYSVLAHARGLLLRDAEAGTTDALGEAWAAADLASDVGGHRYRLRIVDEDRKLNVNLAVLPPSDPRRGLDLRRALRRLIEQAGGSPSDFERIRVHLAGQGMAASAKDRFPRNPAPMVAALRELTSLDVVLFQREPDKPSLADLVCTHPMTININTASETLLTALWNSPPLSQSILSARQARPYRDAEEVRDLLRKHLTPEIAESSMSVLDVQSRFFTVAVEPEDAMAAEDLVALVRRDGKHSEVLYARLLQREAAPWPAVSGR